MACVCLPSRKQNWLRRSLKAILAGSVRVRLPTLIFATTVLSILVE